ncbi:MAG: hypothetical protein WC081_02715 [Candidatus Ratteibacteria bacterium]|jgi:hypothetical protein
MKLFVRTKSESNARIDYAVSVLKRRLGKLDIEVVRGSGKPILDIVVQDPHSSNQAFTLRWMPDVNLDAIFDNYFTYTTDVSAEKIDVVEVGDMDKNSGSLVAQGPAGVLYGILEFAERCETRGCLPIRPLDISRNPKMAFRSACLMLMGTATYDVDICQAEFPWFYDKAWWTTYLDFMAENRFNAVSLWNFHPFPYFITIKGYEDLNPVNPAQVEQNHEQLMWICAEAARRSMSIVFHFYNIYVSHQFAARTGMQNIHSFTNQQKPLIEKYMFECVQQMVSEFPAVGWMACLGEGVKGEDGGRFAGEVLLPAVKASGKHPLFIIRQWSSLKTKHVADHILGRYDNLYVMLKHNAEHIAGEVPDARMRKWVDLGVPCIANMHMLSEVGPFRWAPVKYINRICLTYQALGLKGVHVFPLCPGKISTAVADAGYTGTQIDRDRLYHEAWGRYSFDPIKDEDEEVRFWVRRMADRFGGRKKAKAIIESQNVMGHSLTRLQQHLWIHYDNHSILSAGFTLEQYVEALSVHGRKIVFTDILDDLFPLGLELSQGHQSGKGDYTIEDCLADSIREVESAVSLLAAAGIPENMTEAGRYMLDAVMIRKVLEFHSLKIGAARCIFAHKKQDDLKSFAEGLKLLRRSVKAYKDLAQFAQGIYVGISNVNPVYPKALPGQYHWTDMLPLFEAELDNTRKEYQRTRKAAAEKIGGQR